MTVCGTVSSLFKSEYPPSYLKLYTFNKCYSFYYYENIYIIFGNYY